MSTARRARISKRQLGQFITPVNIAAEIVSYIKPSINDKILEPSFGNGSFIKAVLDYFLKKFPTHKNYLGENIYGVEIDKRLFDQGVRQFNDKFGSNIFKNMHLYLQDFFLWSNTTEQSLFGGMKKVPDVIEEFDLVVGNPPFGGTFNAEIEDTLDRMYGERLGHKIKKETYSFFIVKSVDLLKAGGRIVFICSDTFLTINTMKGLRNLLMSTGSVEITSLNYFSEETTHPMVVINYLKGEKSDYILIDKKKFDIKEIYKTPNLSWKIDAGLLKYFSSNLLGKYVVATSGMTIGKNEYFLKSIHNGLIKEIYTYEYYKDKITLEQELKKARLGKLSINLRNNIARMQSDGHSAENVRIRLNNNPLIIRLPNPNYRYYNKGQTELIYAEPKYVIYWENDGKAVYTFKKNGPWYLHGVGGKKYFGKEGITWQLVASRIYARYLPAGYILDSGAPCAFLRAGIDQDELYFILGWLVTNTATKIQKTILNHTRNIQGKDIERLPYPYWVLGNKKKEAIKLIKRLIDDKIHKGIEISRHDITQIEQFYVM